MKKAEACEELERVDYIICGDYVLPMTEGLPVIEEGAVAVKDKKIVAVEREEALLKKYTSPNIVEGGNKAVLPGLINTHTHAAMVYFRGIADDLPLTEWLNNHIWPAENRWLSHEFISDAIELACVEMLKGGITTFNDMYFFEDAAGESCKKVGMRAVLGSGILDFPSVSAKSVDEYLSNAEMFVHNWKGDELITPCIAPHALYTCCPETLMKAKAMANKLGVPLHIHLAETQWEVEEIKLRYKLRPVEHLARLGFLDESVLAAHCVWLEDNEIELLAKHKVGVAHCMESNLKLASGFAPVASMLSSGVRVTFGTDGAASNNDLNILSEMSTTAKVHKALSGNPTVLDAKTIVLMATRWGAEATGIGMTCGSLDKGKLADIISLDLSKPHLTPIYNIYSHMVYAAMASDVDTVMVNGRIVVR
ncbi:MAG TPA: amidohydrolase, partial [Thermodesulfovibrionales bacterium]|nr:amidohydrolase [Thermodesulfovibrionales bacterium]